MLAEMTMALMKKTSELDSPLSVDHPTDLILDIAVSADKTSLRSHRRTTGTRRPPAVRQPASRRSAGRLSILRSYLHSWLAQTSRLPTRARHRQPRSRLGRRLPRHRLRPSRASWRRRSPRSLLLAATQLPHSRDPKPHPMLQRRLSKQLRAPSRDLLLNRGETLTRSARPKPRTTRRSN